MLLLAWLPWWIDLPLLLAVVAVQLVQPARLHGHDDQLRLALRWGLAGLLLAVYRSLQGHQLALTLSLLAALSGFSLLVLLESWLKHKPVRNRALAASAPEWRELALAPVGPAAEIVELQLPAWTQLDDAVQDNPVGITWHTRHRCRVGGEVYLEHVEPRVSIAPGQRWLVLPITAGRGVVLYDRTRAKQYRLRGWQLYGWHGGEAWLSRGDDRPPLALSHVLGQDQGEE
ncbi:hypothetical protein IGX34_00730 [Dyella sp. 7MK23]|uniref:DUF4131 domain-containing protein n=2 Tax=Dyella acidiphila TaxID=2775866 RepID=A0ABR9G4B7_9GAMM|nr:hypothetical protein [Dyella acidiphila]MBE1158888.1 hypothetical protein [Dyella acidiphila]